MRVLLDTDAMTHLIRADRPQLSSRVMTVALHDRFTSAISLGELLYGFERSARHEHLRAILDEIVLPELTVLPFDEAAAYQYAVLRVSLEREGQTLHEADLRIAAIALAHNLALITGNTRHFRRIPGLRVYDWLNA